MKTHIRVSTMEDTPALKRWLMEPGILRWFPMCNEVEVDDSIRVWMTYQEQGATLTIADEKETPLGMAVLYVPFFQKLKHQSLFAIVVDSAYRGKGLGTELYQALEKRAQELGIHLIHLEVYEGNPAQRLYERLGFTVYGRHHYFLKEAPGDYITRIVMQKEI